MDIPNNKKKLKILIINLNGIGDNIALTPLVINVKSYFLKSEIDLLVKNKSIKSIYGSCKIINEFIYLDNKKFSILQKLKVILKLKKKNMTYHLLLLIQIL